MRLQRHQYRVLLVVALVSYAIAFLMTTRGAGHYDQYVEAYTQCFYSVPGRIIDDGSCGREANVQTHLLAHKQYYTVGEIAFNCAVLLSGLLMVAWPLGVLRRRLISADPLVNPPTAGTA